VDIEFLVQYLQLLHGKDHPRVRIQGTYNALRALKRERLLDHDDYHMLLRAYLFIRKLESRMRIVSNQAISELSRDPEKLYSLARRMGYGDDGSPTGQKLLADYEELSAEVRGIFEKIVSITGNT
jgi:glutamate-ammonia-ligase adenylyltransferase